MIEKYYMIEFWAKKLLLIIEVLKNALAEKNLHTLNELNQEIIDYQIQIYCPEDPITERTLKTLSNKIAVIVYNYEAVIDYDEINSIQEEIKSLNLFKKTRRLTQNKQIKDRRTIFQISEKKYRTKYNKLLKSTIKNKQAKEDQANVKIFFCTNRAINGDKNYGKSFGGDRGEILYGEATVSIPDRHKIGKTEVPKLFDFGSKPFKRLYIKELIIHSEEKYYDIISGFHNNDALMFFHGFNVSFESAVITTAQITYDLDFKGTPFLFSWPSRN